MNARAHWERIYHTLAPTELTWYQERPRLSLALIQDTGVSKAAQIIDVGGGTSTLVDELLGKVISTSQSSMWLNRRWRWPGNASALGPVWSPVSGHPIIPRCGH